MDNREKKKLKRQLESQVMALDKQEGASLSISVVTACRGLLKMASDVPLSQFSDAEFEEIYASYLALAKCIEDFRGAADSRVRAKSTHREQDAVFDTLKLALTETNTNRMSAEAAKHELDEIRETNKKTEKELESLREAIQNEKRRNGTLQNSKTGALAKVEAQRKNNEDLLSLVDEQKSLLLQMKKQEEELHAQNARVLSDIEKTQMAIDTCPHENKALLAQYEEKKATLEKLNHAKAECSPEVQTALKKEIDELIPVVEELQTNCDALTARLNELKKKEISYNRGNETLSTNVLTFAERALGDLAKVLGEHNEALLTVKKTADELSEKTKRCMEMRDGYRDWFAVQETPLTAMIRATALPESQSLKETLDIGKLETVRALMEKTKSNLEELDRILQPCSIAVREDHQNVLRRTHI